MLEVAFMGLHVAQMTGQADMHAIFDAITVNGARALHLEGYGIDVGSHADMVLLQARSRIEALRVRPARLAVIRRGQVIATTPRVATTVSAFGEPSQIDFLHMSG